MKNKYISVGLILFIQFFCVSCKSDKELALESAIDEFEFARYQKPLKIEKIEKLKLKFENLKYDNVTALYYLSEISQLQNKFQEAYNFISQAYELSHADSIYRQKEKIKALIPIQEFLIEDSHSKDILWINDNMLVFKTNEKYITSQKNNDSNTEQEKFYSDSSIEKLIKTGRADVERLYNDKQYFSAINNTKMLIQLIKDLKEEKYIKKELSQLYQDLAILYAKKNNITEANTAIDRAIELNPSEENTKIKILINK